MKKVMVFGIFDIIHLGHLDFLEQAKSIGDYLIVTAASDAYVKKVKKRSVLQNEKERQKSLEKLAVVDKVIIADLDEFPKVVIEEKPQFIALGYDQKLSQNFYDEIKKNGLKVQVKKMKAYRPDLYQSSLMR